jgi:predicted HicB family RNase H-like nuclease
MTGTQQTARIGVVPNQPKTKNCVVRLAPDLREPMEEEARRRGLSLSDVIREAVKEHNDRRAEG